MRTINITDNTLSELIEQDPSIKEVKHLRIVGDLESEDLKTLQSELVKIEFLDISETGIEDIFNFRKLKDLKFIIIPNNTLKISRGAFSGCSSLEKIIIPNSVTEIEAQAFKCCINLSSITIPNKVTIIGNEAFYYCQSLKSVKIPSSVTHIGDAAFEECSNLSSVIIAERVSETEKKEPNCSSSSKLPTKNRKIGRAHV